LLRLSYGISSECHHATPTANFTQLSLLWEGGIMLLFRLHHGISSGCHHATHTPFFDIIIVGRGIMLLLRLS